MSDSNALFTAISEGDPQAVAALLSEDPSLARTRDERGLSPVLQAAYRRNPALVEALLAAAPPLDALEAAAVGDEEQLGALLAEDPGRARERSADGFTPLHYAAFFAHPACTRLILRAGAEVDAVAANPSELRPINSAAAGGSADIVRALLEAGAAPDARQTGGITALMAAAHQGREDLVELLLAAGADPGLRCSTAEPKSAAGYAREAGHGELAARLEG